jgi:uncharacterized protein YutE (UPF0331/DUF86 family)
MMEQAIIKRRLAELQKNLKALQDLQPLGFEELFRSTEKIWAVEHGLQISIQIVLDIGNHLLAQRGENDINDYADILTRLGVVGILPLEFSLKIRQMAGFRNLLVHEYAQIDLKEVHRVLQENLSDFETFGKCVEVYLASQTT